MKRTVLLIEDNEQNRYLLKFLLERHGYSVSTASDGAHGIQAASQLVPDLILLDIQLPTMDGYTVARQLRHNNALQQVPIIAVTSYAMPGDRENAVDAGCTGYIEKPINPETFIAQLESILQTTRQSPQPRVLIVEDNNENRYFLHSLLSAHGYDVACAQHGAEALVKAREAPPELVISDLLMPVMDGYTLLRHWRADDTLKRVPFVVYTATYTEPEDEQLALRLGADAFVLKPSEPEEFLNRIRNVQKTSVAELSRGACQPVADPAGLLQEYSETLIRKLEDKTIQLENSNRLLQEDIAARKLVDAALRESEERFRQLAENVDDVFWLTDREGLELFYVSPAYETIWHCSVASLELAPRSWLQSVHPEDLQRVQTSLEVYATGHWDETFRIVRPDGTARWIRSRAYPVRDAQGQVYRVASVSRDITEYRQLEDELRQAQKMEAVGRLAGGIAHDFNNLLSVILSYAELAIKDLKAHPSIRSDMEEILCAGERAAALTRQLLAFSRQQVLAPRVVDVRQVVFDMETMLRRLLGEDVNLTIDASDSPANVHADPSQLQQIIMNLAVNARDAMPLGGKLKVEIKTAQCASASASASANVPACSEMAQHTHVLLAVSDSGSGMDANTRERLFEPFFTTKEQGKGTGLGLSTVFGIVKQSRGQIQVHSEPDKGATFKIYLPCTDRVDEIIHARHSVPVTLRGTASVLLVEDDQQVRATSRAILQRNGYTVLDAQDGAQACLLSEQLDGKLDLLLTDVVLPRMSGRELAEHLSRKRPDMKVLYTSGYTEDAILRRGILDAGIAFLQKPITPEALLRKVAEVLAPS